MALRSRVTVAHDLLDGTIGEWCDQRDYCRYLMGIACFRLAAELAVSDVIHPDWFGDWRPVRTGKTLLQDLDALGLPLPEVYPISRPASSSGLLGMYYTLEGSALGARVLIKRAATLGYSGNYGAAHLQAQTALPAQWRNFLDILEQAPSFCLDEAEAAASMMFRHAYMAMTGMERVGSQYHG